MQRGRGRTTEHQTGYILHKVGEATEKEERETSRKQPSPFIIINNPTTKTISILIISQSLPH